MATGGRGFNDSLLNLGNLTDEEEERERQWDPPDYDEYSLTEDNVSHYSMTISAVSENWLMEHDPDEYLRIPVSRGMYHTPREDQTPDPYKYTRKIREHTSDDRENREEYQGQSMDDDNTKQNNRRSQEMFTNDFRKNLNIHLRSQRPSIPNLDNVMRYYSPSSVGGSSHSYMNDFPQVFMKENIEQRLDEEAKRVQFEAVVKLQTCIKMYLERRKFLRMQQATVKIQSVIQSWVTR